MRRHRFRSLLALTTLSALVLAVVPAPSYAADPEPGTRVPLRGSRVLSNGDVARVGGC